MLFTRIPSECAATAAAGYQQYESTYHLCAGLTQRPRRAPPPAGCIAGLLLSLVEYLTKFATIWAAIKGDAFLAAGRAVTDLLTRNLLDSLRIWCGRRHSFA